VITCPVCGFEDIEHLGKRSDHSSISGYSAYVANIWDYDCDIVKCGVCGVQFIHPMYDASLLAGLYNHEDYLRFASASAGLNLAKNDLTPGELNWVKSKFASLGLASWREDFVSENSRLPRFLDVGCGSGIHLLAFKEMGFRVTGIDLSKEFVHRVKTVHGIEAWQTTVEEFTPNDKFDCVLASHLIEHTASPKSFFKAIPKLLAPGGLLILETPVAEDSGQTHERYRDIYHTLFFDHFSLFLLAAFHGMKVVQYRNFMSRRSWDGDYHFYLAASFRRDEKLSKISWSRSAIQTMRAAFDGTYHDFLQLGRHYLDYVDWRYPMRNEDQLIWLVHKGLVHLRRVGVIETAKRALAYMTKRGRKTRRTT